MIEHYRLDEGLAALLGVPTWHHFLFFTIGVCARKYFSMFEHLLDRRYTTCLLLLVFALFALPLPFSEMSSMLTHLLLAVCGICLVFAYLREQEEAFSRNRFLGRVAQYVGRHTLDIYLIHYFFIFSNIGVLAPDFSQLNSPFMELVCSAGLSFLVVAACLLVSSVLRLSPVMAHYLFGQKI